MRINIQIPATPKRTRILCAFMAFLILALTFQQAFVGWEAGIRVSAADPTPGNGRIIQVQTYSQYMGQDGYKDSHGDDGSVNGEYTGKILPQSVSMYDYLTDYEKNNNEWNKLSGNRSNYTWYARYEPYKQFNRVISGLTGSPGTITVEQDYVVFKYISDFEISGDVYVYMWATSGGVDTSYSAYPGEKMTANAARTEFTYTIPFDDLPTGTMHCKFNGGSGKWGTDDITIASFQKGYIYTFGNYGVHSDSNKISVELTGWGSLAQPNYVYTWGGSGTNGWPGDFLTVSSGVASTNNITFTSAPAHIIFSNSYRSNNNWLSNWQTVTIDRQLVAGHKYAYKLGGIKSGNEYYLTGSDFGYNYYKVFTYDPIQIPTTVTRSKLYQGYFLADADYVTTPNGQDRNNMPGNYTNDNKAENQDNGIISSNQKYNNFFWQANMAQRPLGSGQGDQALPKSSVLGLVDNTLNGNNLVTQGDIVLPYFYKSYTSGGTTTNNSLVTSGLMKCWEGTEEKSISFPFYEVLSPVSTSAGGDLSSNQKATFYQFNSKDSTLHFKYNDTNPEKSYFEERQPATINRNGNDEGKVSNESDLHESIRASNGKVGFFPFNDGRANSTTGEGDSSNESVGSKNGYKNNYGFGAKFEMTFKLSEDGKMAATHDSDGNKLASNVTPARVNTRFEFNGDDDLWVFIDGNLVLDMGGNHSASYGYIDFATKTVFAQNAIKYGVGGADYLGVDGKNGITELTGTAFTDKIAESTTGDNGGYNPNKLHTMTIFYMERGMAESNLFIRFNFPAESNFNKLKVKEQTDFSGVNAGLREVTKIAADTDVFKYKIENKGTDADAVLQMNTKYPTQENYVRQITSTQTNKTKLASSTSTNPDSSWFDVANITADSDGYKPVKNTNYNWVDEYALNTAGEKMDSGKLVGGKTDADGFMYLMYGTPKNDATGEKEVKSSGEFEDQFTRYSKLKVTQQTDLRTPDSHSVGTNDAAASLTSQTSPARTFDDYYTLNQSYIFSTTNSTPVNIGNGQEFSFRNAIDTANPANGDNTTNKDTGEALKSKVIMTAQFVNAPKTADIEIKKVVTGSTNQTDFGFEIELSDVFGISTASVTNHGALVSSKNSGTATTSNISGTNKGTFTLQNGDTLKISGIPVHTKYKITETSGRGQTVTGEVTDGEIQTSDNGTTIKVTVTNKFQTETGVDVHKTDSTGNTNLSGAEFELWYKETLTPPTYIFNEPELVPNQLNTMKVTATPGELGVPGFEIPSTITTYKFTTNYTAPALPTVTDTDWILPRNDTDYIYFRDYNVGAIGWEDKASFTAQNGSNDGKRSWRQTNFGHHNGHNQDQELFFGDNDTYWMAAEFSGGGKKTIRYAMWERFVDKYDKDGNNTEDVVTTVWKIQPPDGYTHVKFMMLVGDTVIRESKTIAYELGKIYHKTAWGKWTKRNGIDSYYDVPVVAEDGYWAPDNTDETGNTTYDKRKSGSTMLQARKYEPTAQKVIFHCNSTNVWHNIHIEFFEDSAGDHPVNGQAFPGYMMEPYAYAGSDYRMSDGYLTYELTIPATAKYFRINNGELTGAYAYMTAVTSLNDGSTTAKGKGKKNYGNYWCFGTDSNDNNATLVQWTPQKEEKGATNKIPDKDYKNAEVTSDYDYIYFAKPAGWTNVYAYFYAGGNLRADNWQRACYSSWPGVAPAGTEYGTVHSNTYSIKTTGDTYNGTTTTGELSPETTISGGTIYKFRIPKGDRTNYSKVVFNNGLTAVGGGDETGVIEYQPGHIYTVKGKATKHYENSPTVLYEAKTITVNDNKVTEYLYVKNIAGWDDLHITFYDANGGQILQQGKGYVMDYAGDLGRDYFKIPIPTSAVKFSVNNGIGSANASKVSPMADIVRLNADGTVKDTPETTDKFVYELTDTSDDVKLTRSTIAKEKVVDKQGQETPQEEGFKDYTMIDNPATSGNNKADPEKIPQVRQTTKNGITTDDTLNIRDMAGWDAKIGEISVTFYTDDDETIGPNVMMKTVADAQGKKWYTKKIHPDATSFTITYMDKNDSTKIYTTPKYPIYANVATGGTDGQERTESGCMFFDTKDSGVDSKLVMTNVEPAKIGNEVDDETYPKRGDYLYIVNTQNALPLSITFYASGTNVIKSGVTAKYINTVTDASPTEYWFKVSIPEGAQSFVIDGVAGMTAQPIYELKAKASVYQKDYTLGDMQYKFNGTATTLVYPVFTPTPVDELEISDGYTLTSKVAVLVDEDAIASYNGTATLPETTDGSTPSKEILYNTVTADKDDITYSWTSGAAPDNRIRFDNRQLGWSTVKAYFFNGNGAVGTAWAGTTMQHLGTDPDGVLSIAIPDGATGVIFNNGSSGAGNQTDNIMFADVSGGVENKIYTPTYNTSTDKYVYFSFATDPKSGDWQGYVYFFGGNYSGPDFPGTFISYTYTNIGGSPTSNKAYKIKVPSGATTAIFSYYYEYDGVYHRYRTVNVAIDNITAGKGIYGKMDKETNSSFDKTVSGVNVRNDIVEYSPTDGVIYNSTISSNSFTGGSFSPYEFGGGQSTYAYQPEDRYGMISDDNTNPAGVLGAADVNDFIKITLPDTVTKPYIKFYNGNTEINNATGSTASTKGLLLNGSNMTLNSSSYTIPVTTGTGTKTYQVRLPKNATKFEILNDTDEYGGKQNIGATNVTATIGTSGQSVTLDTFRHAGTTFTYTESGGTVSVTTTLRTGFTPYKTAAMTDPLKPMSDADFVFFTDTNGTFASTRNKVYAYFYGAADGEYTAWPGIMADSANTTAAATSYINNNGDKVYKFRIPKDDDGNYTKVIFTDGQSSPKITAAQTIVGGTNYILGSANTQDYGTMTAANNVYDVTTESKTASPTTAPYNSADNRTIYIIDNGTICNASGETEVSGRYILDDMHIEFFGSDGVTHIGTPEGYIPEKADTHTDGTVYRITVPSNAMFFRINNGNGKADVTTAHNHSRKSEIKQITDNGLYEFVTDAKYTKDGSDPQTVSALSAPEYLLTLINKIDLEGDTPTSETYDVHLATIRTGADGKTSTILWVKDDLDNVDTEYLVDSSSIPIKVKKDGTYYWKEVTPPSGYKLSTTPKVEFTLPPNGEYAPAEFRNPDIEKGSLTLKKKLHSVDATDGNTTETAQLFTFTIELNAPVGTVWSQFTTNSVTLANSVTGAEIVSDTGSTTTSLNRVITVKLPANDSTTVTVSNIPYGTTYNITETAPTDYSSTPVEIKYQNSTIVEEMKGTVNAAATSYLVTDRREVGSLNLKMLLSTEVRMHFIMQVSISLKQRMTLLTQTILSMIIMLYLKLPKV